MSAKNRISRLEETLRMDQSRLPLMVTLSHEEADRIVDAYRRAGWEDKDICVIVIDTKPIREGRPSSPNDGPRRF